MFFLTFLVSILSAEACLLSDVLRFGALVLKKAPGLEKRKASVPFVTPADGNQARELTNERHNHRESEATLRHNCRNSQKFESLNEKIPSVRSFEPF